MMVRIRSVILISFGFCYFFFMSALFSFLLFFFPARKLYPLVRFLCAAMLVLVGIRFWRFGYERFDPTANYLIMCNHESVFDVFALPSSIPMYMVAVEAAHHFSMPIYGLFIRKWGCLPVHRNDNKQARKDLKNVAAALKKDISVIILPEGHRTLDGEIGPFKKGPFHLAKETQATILPCALTGLYEVKQKNHWLIRPGRAAVTFGEPIPAEKYQHLSTDELSSMIRERITELRTECRSLLEAAQRNMVPQGRCAPIADERFLR